VRYYIFQNAFKALIFSINLRQNFGTIFHCAIYLLYTAMFLVYLWWYFSFLIYFWSNAFWCPGGNPSIFEFCLRIDVKFHNKIKKNINQRGRPMDRKSWFFSLHHHPPPPKFVQKFNNDNSSRVWKRYGSLHLILQELLSAKITKQNKCFFNFFKIR